MDAIVRAVRAKWPGLCEQRHGLSMLWRLIEYGHKCDDLSDIGDAVADLYAWIQRNRPELAHRIIFTVWNAPDPELGEALAKSGCPVVRKPFQIEDFWKQVQTTLSAEVHAPTKR